jgi:uncharacterized protein (DUF433 family)
MCDESGPLAGMLVVREGFREGRPCIAGTGITVHTIAAQHLQGQTPEEILDGFPRAGRAGVYAALAYFFAHEPEILADFAADDHFWKRSATELNATVI